MELLIVLAVYTALALTDFMTVVRGKQKTVIWIYSIIFVISFAILALKSVEVDIPPLYISIKRTVEQYLHR